MRTFRRYILGLAVVFSILLALVAPAWATSRTLHAQAPSVAGSPYYVPACGDHFQLTRKGSDVRIVGVDLSAFSLDYMLVYVAEGGSEFGSPYNASPYGGASFEINTGSSSKKTIAISLTNDNNTETLCASDYYA